jgi:hypothetical protein
MLASDIDWEAGTAGFVAEGPLSYAMPSISGELQVVEPPTDPAEFVQISLEVGDIIDRGMDRGKWRNGAYHQRFVLRAMSGSATGPAGEQLLLTDCTFADYSSMDRYSSRAGQKPGGRPPMNDLPANAQALSASATEKVSTRGAAIPPEAPCVVAEGDGEWELPFGRTVWYSFEGTGSDVTLSTSGSDFDTVMGVYDAGLSQVSCVDDVWADESGSLQAEVTVPTDPGTVYLVQVGGFDPGDLAGPEWGNVILTRS